MQTSPDDLPARGPSSPEGLETPNSGTLPTPQAKNLPWIPVRSLAPRHRDRILQHLLALSEHDRYLRFGYSAADAQIGRYVDGLDFNRDELFGVFNRRLSLIAMAHLACPPPAEPGSEAQRSAEFGVSVSAHARGRGYGARLFEHAVLHARNRGLDQLFIHALSENTAMLKIARQAGAEVRRDGSESEAYLSLPPETWASQVEQMVDTSAAALDYQLKLQAHFVGSMIGVGGDAKTNAVAGSSDKD